MEFQQCVEKNEDQVIQNIGQTSSHVWLQNMENERKVMLRKSMCFRTDA